MVALMGTAAAMGLGGDFQKLNKTYTFFTRAGVLYVGLTHIATMLLVIIVCLQAINNLRHHFPRNYPPRSTALPFTSIFLSLVLTALRLATLASPVQRNSFNTILTIGELTLCTSVACLPSLVIARVEPLAAAGNLDSRPSSPWIREPKKVVIGNGRTVVMDETGGIRRAITPTVCSTTRGAAAGSRRSATSRT
ncbi:hypothetical protein BDZ91DRAFT_780954 [Kalaharituber pfeilii]|nr:hypothetical protein BDZ91DRAFT_780954 [Kalaharituber pfeilii]